MRCKQKYHYKQSKFHFVFLLLLNLSLANCCTKRNHQSRTSRYEKHTYQHTKTISSSSTLLGQCKSGVICLVAMTNPIFVKPYGQVEASQAQRARAGDHMARACPLPECAYVDESPRCRGGKRDS